MDVAGVLEYVWFRYSSGWGLWVSIGMYVWFVLCLAAIARQHRIGLWWLAPLPVANFGLMCTLGKSSARCFWALTVPFLALALGLIIWIPLWTAFWLVVWAIAWAVAWMRIAGEMSKPPVVGLLIVIPVANLVLLGVLAFGE